MGQNEFVEELKKIYTAFNTHNLTELSEEEFIKENVDYIFNHSMLHNWDRRVAETRLKELTDELMRTLRP